MEFLGELLRNVWKVPLTNVMPLGAIGGQQLCSRSHRYGQPQGKYVCFGEVLIILQNRRQEGWLVCQVKRVQTKTQLVRESCLNAHDLKQTQWGGRICNGW